MDDEDLYLDPDAALNAAQKMAQATGDGINVTGPTLRKRLKDRGLLASVDPKRQRLCIRKELQGARRTVLHLSASALISAHDRPNRPNCPNQVEEAASSVENADFSVMLRDGSDGAGKKQAHRTGPQQSPAGSNGPVSRDGQGHDGAEPAHENPNSDGAKEGNGPNGTVGTVTTTTQARSHDDLFGQPIATTDATAPAESDPPDDESRERFQL